MSKYDHSQSPIHIILYSWKNVNSLTITSMTPLLEFCSVIKLACQLLDASRYLFMLCRYLLVYKKDQILYVWLLINVLWYVSQDALTQVKQTSVNRTIVRGKLVCIYVHVNLYSLMVGQCNYQLFVGLLVALVVIVLTVLVSSVLFIVWSKK